MRIDVAPVLMDFDGNPIMQNDGVTKWTVGLVLITAALGGPAPGTTFGEDEQVGRFMLAIDIRDGLRSIVDGMLEAPVEIPDSMVANIRASVSRGFGPILAGPVIRLLRG